MKLIKKLSVLLLALSIFITVPFTAFAQDVTVTDESVQYFEDGSYLVTEITESITPFSSGTKSKAKTVTFYENDDEKQWSVTLHTTFKYTGTSVSCTNAYTSHVIYDSAWKVTQDDVSKAGSIVTGTFVVKKYWLGIITKTIPLKIVTSCDRNGNIT